MNIKKTFLNLTSRTYPHGTEHLLEEFLPKDIKKDRFGNYFYQVGDDSRVIFASHLDTVSGEYKDIYHTFDEKEKIIGTDGTTTLGADDKAGVTIMLYMINNKVPGLYYFFIGEEVGCIGSNKVSSQNQIFNKYNYDKVISFDRRGNTSVITHQSKLRCCSDEFAEALCHELNSNGMGMETDTNGVCTDSLEFINDIPECTNISVGYLDEHTFDETQDLDFLVRISKSCIKINWEKLPTKRDPSIVEKKKKTYTGNTSSPRSSRIRNNHNLARHHRNLSMEESMACAYHNPLDDPTVNSSYGPFEDDTDTGDYYHDNDNDNYSKNDILYDKDNEILNWGGGDSLNKRKNVFFDNIDNDAKIEMDIEESEIRYKYFENVKDKYLNDDISEKELDIIKDQLLDENDPSDEIFIEELNYLVNRKSTILFQSDIRRKDQLKRKREFSQLKIRNNKRPWRAGARYVTYVYDKKFGRIIQKDKNEN